MRKSTIAVMVLLGSPMAASAFQTGDELTWPADGKFPAYPPEQPDGRSIKFSVFGGLHRDSNLFRLSDSVDPQTAIGSSEKSDTIRRLGVGLKAAIPVSRQRFLFDAQIEDYDFDRFGFLDHRAYRAGAAWKWQAGSQLSGDVGYSKRRFLAGFGELQGRVRDLITEDRAYAGAAYLATPRWRVRGALDSYDWRHSESTRAALDNRTNSATAGLDYMTPAGNSIGGQVKYSEGNYPNRQLVAGSPVDNQYEEIETSAVAQWNVTGKSRIDARLGYTSRKHDQVSQRDFQGITGRLNYDWTIAAKTLLNMALWREIRSIEDVDASYVLSQGFSVGPAWAPTSKLVLQAKLLREKRDFEGDPGFVLTASPQREDTFRGARLSAGYTPLRNVELSLSLEKGDRSSNIAGRDYDYNAVNANARFSF
jgi:exopolysaccharide biosynthesis operon protein EpsL